MSTKTIQRKSAAKPKVAVKKRAAKPKVAALNIRTELYTRSYQIHLYKADLIHVNDLQKHFFRRQLLAVLATVLLLITVIVANNLHLGRGY